MKITGTTPVSRILSEYPDSFEVFLRNGFPYPDGPAMIREIGEDTMLQTVLRVREMNLELFLYDLENAILKAEQERRYVLEDFNPWDYLDFYGNTICPLKFTFKDALEELERDHARKTGTARKCYVEAGKNSNDTCDELWSDPDPERFPAILFTKEFNQYLGRDFRERMADKGYFTTDFYRDIEINPQFANAGLMDPLGQYGVYAVMADVLLVDRNKLGDLPVPRTRKDLLDPRYRDRIVLFGKDRTEISNATFLYIYKEFGMDGIRSLARNVKHALHGAQMSRMAGSANTEGGAVYLVSWFFAKTCVKPNVEIVWPEDGCMTLPMYLLVRKDRLEAVRDIVDYIVGDEFAAACSRAYTPAANAAGGEILPPGAKLAWLGWDYIRSHDLEAVAGACKDVFFAEWERTHREGRMFL